MKLTFSYYNMIIDNIFITISTIYTILREKRYEITDNVCCDVLDAHQHSQIQLDTGTVSAMRD